MKNKLPAILITLTILVANPIFAAGFDLIAHPKHVSEQKIPKDCHEVLRFDPEKLFCKDKNNNYFFVYYDSWIYRINLVREI